jgi:soluble lytic murein transglycosylase
MKRNRSFAIPLILITIISIILGIIINAVRNYIEIKNNPTTYNEIVKKYSLEYGVPERVIFATIKTESSFRSDAVSSAGAMGLMQMMPSTFEWLTSDEHLDESLPKDALFDPEVSIRYGTYYLSYLAKKFDYDWTVVSAAYNAGEGRVLAWLESGEYTDDNGDLIKIPIKETKAYVKKINDAIDTYTKLYPELT